MLAHFVG